MAEGREFEYRSADQESQLKASSHVDLPTALNSLGLFSACDFEAVLTESTFGRADSDSVKSASRRSATVSSASGNRWPYRSSAMATDVCPARRETSSGLAPVAVPR
jgi:hypothetical protein